MCIKMNKKGFTLIEAILALGITVVLLQMVVFFMLDIDKFIVSSGSTINYNREINTLERVITEDIINSIDKNTISKISDMLIIGDNTLSIKKPSGDDINYTLISNNLVRTEGVYSEVLIEKTTIFSCSYIDKVLNINMVIENSNVSMNVKIINDYWNYERIYP